MISIVVVFPKLEDSKAIRSLFVRHGYDVAAVCTSGDQAMTVIDNLDYGIVVCGYKFNDMMYSELKSNLPKTFEMLLIASQTRINDGIAEGVVSVVMPIKTYDLMNTVEMLIESIDRRRKKMRSRPRERNDEDRKCIEEAKRLLMERNNMLESEAHRYIQKNSMDSGTNMVETAQMILQIFH